jgi:hypothetical protein
VWRTEIFDEDLASGNDGRLIGKTSPSVLERLLRGRIEEANTVKVANVGGLSN